MNKCKQLAIQALQQMKSDNSARAKLAFRGFTLKQMSSFWGQSGRSRSKILDCYLERDRKIDAAIEWVKKGGN